MWDTELGKWYEPIYEAYKGNLFELLLTPAGEICERTLEGFRHESCFKGRYIVNQWTGLYDKNNNKIFEGDIVKVRGKTGFYTAKVEFVNGAFCAGIHESNDSRKIKPMLITRCEIVGNVYQNPEILL